jgi:hypothetical protein
LSGGFQQEQTLIGIDGVDSSSKRRSHLLVIGNRIGCEERKAETALAREGTVARSGAAAQAMENWHDFATEERFVGAERCGRNRANNKSE